MEPRRVPCLSISSAAHQHHDDCAESQIHRREICSSSSCSQETIRQQLKDEARIFNNIQNNDNGFNIGTDKAKPTTANSSWDQKCTNNKTTASECAFSDGAADELQQDRSWPSHPENRPMQSSNRLHRQSSGASKYLPHHHQHQPDRRAKTTTTTTPTRKLTLGSFSLAGSQSRMMQLAMLVAAAGLLANSLFGLADESFANSTALGGSSAAPVKDLAAAESALVSSAAAAAAASKESLVASESSSQQQQLAYAPPVDPTEASTNQNPNTNPPATTQQSAGAAAETATATDQQQQQQRVPAEDVPAVSGLVNQQEDQQQQPDQQTVGEQVNRQQQQQQQQPSEGVEADQQQQQQQILVDEPESESSRLSRPQQPNTSGIPSSSSSSLAAENDVSPTSGGGGNGGEQFPRKASSAFERQSKSARGGRTLKRAFGGHAGMVFGRKQRPQQQQAAEEQQQVEQQAEQQVDQQQPGARAQRGRDYHYYYTAAPGIPQASSSTKAARPKLKEADYPTDYREILIQPDQQRQSPARPAQVSEQQVEQQPIEQVQVSENEAGAATTTTVAPLQTDAPTELPQSTLNVGEPDEVPPKSGPYIRLSNIATINSTANQAASNGSSEGEMKLMRIYVIDLDQKLVVGNQQQQSANEQTDQATKGLTNSPSFRQVVSSAIAQQQQQQQQQEQAQQTGGEQIGARASEPRLSTLAMPSTSESPLAYTSQQESNTERYLDHSGGVLLMTNQTAAGRQQQLVNYTIDHQLPVAAAAGYLQSAPEAHQYVMTVPSPGLQQQQQQQHQYSLMAPGNSSDNNNSYASYYSNNYNNSSLGSSLAPPNHYNHGSPSFGQQQQQQVDDRQQQQVAVYLAPVQHQQQQQMYPVVPQYIAPQYNTKQQQQQQTTGNPDREQYHQAMAHQQLYSPSPLSSGAGLSSSSLGSHYNSPGSSQQHQYNISASSNYTSQEGAARAAAAAVVQAPGRLPLQPAAAAAQAQDKHHANLNALYQQQQLLQHNEEPVYQQQLQQQQQDFFSAVGAQSEPAQNHRKQQQQYNEPATYKVATSDQWKPVDYSAPAAYSQTSTSQQQHRAPINPAPQYAGSGNGNGNGNGRLINGYTSSSSQNRDHDVVSLANGTVALRHHPGHYQVELVQANYSSSGGQQPATLGEFDGQHAPQLNYQANRKQQPSLAYVNNGTVELQEEYSPAPTAVYQQPSQQHQQQVLPVPTSYHPSSSLSYASSSSSLSNNGSSTSLEWPTDSSADGAYGQQQSGMTNEYPSMAKLTVGGAPNKGVVNYGTGSASAYGKQTKQHSGEAPRIPHTQSTGYRLQQQQQQQSSSYNGNNKPQPPPSAYLAVNGPPISDGVYESPSAIQTEQLAASPYAKPKAKRPQPKPAQKAKGNKQVYQQHRAKEHDSQVAIEQAEQYISEDQQPHQYGPGGVPPYAGAYPPRAPLAAVASLYRGPPSGGGAKSFLSWETISSVASGAAKRLPSLSSILSPFAGGKQHQQLYPTVNHQPPAQHHYSPYKSAHYDRDVSSFHRPYPLRHTNQGYQASYNEHQAHHSQHHSAGESQGPYEPVDLASSSSSEDGEAQHSGQPDDSSGDAADETPESPQQPKTIKLLPMANGNSSTGGVIEASSELPSAVSASYRPTGADATTDSSDEGSAGEKGEPIGDLAQINPEQHQKASSARAQPKKRNRARPSLGAGEHQAEMLAGYQPAADSASPESSSPPDVPGAYVDPSQAAVLSSIEHQLEQHEAHKSPYNKSPRGKHHSMKGKAALPTGSGYVEPTITASSAAGDGLSFDSLPADQQRLLLSQSSRGAHKLAPARFPSAGAGYGEQGGAGLLFGQDGRPIGLPSLPGRYPQQQPGGLTSMQIGQYKITPQTQFVQSIIEPSRQVLGQYFKQYLGQLGQLAG